MLILQSRLRTTRCDDVALTLVEPDSLLERLAGFAGPASERIDVRQGAERIPPPVERVRVVGKGNGLAREPLSGRVVAASREQVCAHMPPEHLRDDIVVCAQRFGRPGP